MSESTATEFRLIEATVVETPLAKRSSRAPGELEVAFGAGQRTLTARACLPVASARSGLFALPQPGDAVWVWVGANAKAVWLGSAWPKEVPEPAPGEVQFVHGDKVVRLKGGRLAKRGAGAVDCVQIELGFTREGGPSATVAFESGGLHVQFGGAGRPLATIELGAREVAINGDTLTISNLV